ncbi:MAG: tyrosine-type recombinase/integrase [Solirubrobacterales bacterium]|nr:tyrosine-type recombinase/integrase [Solirubrobacterales bacterium]
MSSAGWLSLVEEYLSARRGRGFALDQPAYLLRDFARYADAVGHQGPLTTELAVSWAQASRSGSPAQAVRRLGAVRQFARYRALLDPVTEVPPPGLLGRVPRRPQPHIYSDAELVELLDQASRLLPRRGLRPRTYVAFFSLLACTGLRVSEACRLAVEDVDLTAGVLTVREGKYRKARLVPLHPSTTAALERYAAERDACCEDPGRFFRTERTPALHKDTVEKTFGRIRKRLGWTADGRARQPRIHDLRHSFAVHRLLRWYAEGADLDRKLLALSLYLGHAHVSDTYWYLTGVPELMAITAERFERFANDLQSGES